MEAILKNFSIGFLLRSVFAGAFFLVSYYSAENGLENLPSANLGGSITPVLLLSLFVGVVAYGFHRSLFYPFVEWFLNGTRVTKFRTDRLPLISPQSVRILIAIWGRGPDAKDGAGYARHVSTWADYVHLQYVSAECIGFGALASRILHPGTHEWSCALILLAMAFILAGLVSDWRLHVIGDALLRKLDSESRIARLSRDV